MCDDPVTHFQLSFAQTGETLYDQYHNGVERDKTGDWRER